MNNRLRELREAQGWSQGELAEQLEVSRQTVNALETGKYDPSLPLAFRISRLFALRIEDVFLPDWSGHPLPCSFHFRFHHHEGLFR